MGEEWFSPIKEFIEHGTIPLNKLEAKKLIIKAARYSIINGILYRRSFSSPLMRCLSRSEAEDAPSEIPEGSYGNYTRGKFLANKVLRQGYFWPHIYKDAKLYVQKCHKYQRFAPTIYIPAEEYHAMSSPWPFFKWGLI